MDFCRNVSVSGGLPTPEYHQPEQVLSPSNCYKLGNSLDDLFPTHSVEGDFSLEWLSVFVEDCLSSTGNSLTAAVPLPMPLSLPTNTTPNHSKPMTLVGKTTKQERYASSLNQLTIPGKARSKRRRCPTAMVKASFTSWCSHLKPNEQTLNQLTSSDPPLLQQAYWLADSELILPKKEDCMSTTGLLIRTCKSDNEQAQLVVETKEEIEMMMGKASLGSKEASSSGIIEGGFEGQNQQQQQQPRRCTHCMAQRTPQWRAGPMGPKTLCNACGVRYKSGRLLPEYRPAKSPTFVSYKHSNSHKKVLEMRMALLSSNT